VSEHEPEAASFRSTNAATFELCVVAGNVDVVSARQFDDESSVGREDAFHRLTDEA
jgi:hypothetical protein